MKNRFRQRIPGGVDPSITPLEFDFNTTEELVNHEYVKRFGEHEDDSFYAMFGETLMIISEGGYHWWAVGYIKNPENIDLPIWEGPKRRDDEKDTS